MVKRKMTKGQIRLF